MSSSCRVAVTVNFNLLNPGCKTELIYTFERKMRAYKNQLFPPRENRPRRAQCSWCFAFSVEYLDEYEDGLALAAEKWLAKSKKKLNIIWKTLLPSLSCIYDTWRMSFRVSCLLRTHAVSSACAQWILRRGEMPNKQTNKCNNGAYFFIFGCL